jgi:hypothetical protein
VKGGIRLLLENTNRFGHGAFGMVFENRTKILFGA